jgi:hypothetical protein
MLILARRPKACNIDDAKSVRSECKKIAHRMQSEIRTRADMPGFENRRSP